MYKDQKFFMNTTLLMENFCQAAIEVNRKSLIIDFVDAYKHFADPAWDGEPVDETT